MKEKIFNQIDEEVTKEFIDKINSLHELFHSPVFDIVNGFSKYIDSQGRSYMSKFQRNVLAFQRLYMALDSIRDIGFTSEYLNGSFELETTKANRQFIEYIFTRNLVFYNTQLIFSFINFLAYFFDMPEKDENISIYDCINYLYLVDEELCYKLESFLKSEEVNYFISVNAEIQFGFLGLAKITKQTRMENNKKGEFKVNRSLDVPSEKIKEGTTKLLQNFYDTLTVLHKYMFENYTQSLGYNSPSDFIAEVSKEGFYKGSTSKEIDEARINEPIKIYNGVTDLPLVLKTKYFTLVRNRTYKDVESEFYRSTDIERRNIKLNKNGATVSTIVESKQEGRLFWTHSLIFNKEVPLSNDKYDKEEIVCLLLSFFSGGAIYSEKSKLFFSHKTRKLNHLHSFEIASALEESLEKINNSTQEELAAIVFVLSKYRETMQPMTSENRLVRIWEIVDILSDYYCINPKKDIPANYDEKTLRKKLETELKKLQEEINIPLIDGGFTPILIEKSIKAKLKELLNTFSIAAYLNVDNDILKRKTSSAYAFRGSLTHSGKRSSKKEDIDRELHMLVEYSLFVQQLSFVILLKIFDISPKETLKSLKLDLEGYLKNNNYYHEKSEKIKERIKAVEEFGDIISGKKPFPKGKKMIEF